MPTIYFRGLDTLIATARSNKVAVCLGAQDFSQLVRDYGEKEARVIQNTIGNIFSGQVVGETAKNTLGTLRQGAPASASPSNTWTKEDTSTNISTQLDSLIPASQNIQPLTGDVRGKRIGQFRRDHQAENIPRIMVDNAGGGGRGRTDRYPSSRTSRERTARDHMQEEIERNYYRIKEEVGDIIRRELLRIENDPNLSHLLETDGE